MGQRCQRGSWTDRAAEVGWDSMEGERYGSGQRKDQKIDRLKEHGRKLDRHR